MKIFVIVSVYNISRAESHMTTRDYRSYSVAWTAQRLIWPEFV